MITNQGAAQLFIPTNPLKSIDLSFQRMTNWIEPIESNNVIIGIHKFVMWMRVNHESNNWLFFELEVNILSPFSGLKRMIVLVYTHEAISKTLGLHIFRRKPITVGLIDDSKREITLPILFCLEHV